LPNRPSLVLGRQDLLDLIAYQEVGEGSVDILFVLGWVTHIEPMWAEPRLARFFERLASFARVMVFDKRGVGLSDRVPEDRLPSLEVRIDDARAVMDSVGSERAVVLVVSEAARWPRCSRRRTRNAPSP
jgi:pimeloyl-ACP methyl ester carboxylesterase